MIFLDSAATTFLKPPSVRRAVDEAFCTMSSPGRGGYAAAMSASDTVFNCRCAIADMYGVENPERVVFTMNATHALNLAIKTLVPFKGRVVISGWEHNAVTRPLRALEAEITVASGVLFDQESAIDAFRKHITPKTDAVICTHVSNVFGYILPISEIAELCQDAGVPLIIDASQSAGCISLDMRKLKAAFIAFPGHKGLYGPQGTGVLLCGRDSVQPLIEGGTGSLSMQQEMPDFLPDRLEAGTHNVPGIAGLLEGIRYVQQEGAKNILHYEQRLVSLAAEGLRSMKGIRVYEGEKPCQSGVLSFATEKRGVNEMADALSERGFALRSGLHCSPLAHISAGTIKNGTIRLSVSRFNTASEIFRFLNAAEEILDGYF